MKNYRVTVNGVAYDVCVEEINEGTAPAPAAPKAAPAAPAVGGTGAVPQDYIKLITG